MVRLPTTETEALAHICQLMGFENPNPGLIAFVKRTLDLNHDPDIWFVTARWDLGSAGTETRYEVCPWDQVAGMARMPEKQARFAYHRGLHKLEHYVRSYLNLPKR